MASSGSSNQPAQGAPGQQGMHNQPEVGMTHNEQAIAALVQKLVPVFKSQASAIPMQTNQAAGNIGGFRAFLIEINLYIELLLKHDFPFAR
jgi:hypothetical protein